MASGPSSRSEGQSGGGAVPQVADASGAAFRLAEEVAGYPEAIGADDQPAQPEPQGRGDGDQERDGPPVPRETVGQATMDPTSCVSVHLG